MRLGKEKPTLLHDVCVWGGIELPGGAADRQSKLKQIKGTNERQVLRTDLSCSAMKGLCHTCLHKPGESAINVVVTADISPIKL